MIEDTNSFLTIGGENDDTCDEVDTSSDYRAGHEKNVHKSPLYITKRHSDLELAAAQWEPVTYWSLLKYNSNFRLYILSSLVADAGEWFTYVASIAIIEQIHSSNKSASRTSISILVALRLIPKALFSNIGGALADTYDRRTMMFILNILGATIAGLFILAHQYTSISTLYVATVLQMTITGFYEPCRTSLVPMLILEEEGLKKAFTLIGMSWSVMACVGASIGGFATEWAGIDTCFLIDSASYLLSAFLIRKIKGNYVALQTSENEAEDIHITPKNDEISSTSRFLSIRVMVKMIIEGFSYLQSKSWGPLVFLKFSAALIYGASDVLNVSISEQDYSAVDRVSSTTSSLDAEVEGASQRLGILFAFVGIGCFLGPIAIEPFTKTDKISTLKAACLISYLLMVIGYWGLAQSGTFLWICVCISIRSSGANIVWIYSTLLLQSFSSNNMLGRIMAVDFALGTLSEALAAILAGLLQDDAGFSVENVSFVMSIVAVTTLIVWSFYFFFFVKFKLLDIELLYGILFQQGSLEIKRICI